MPEAGVPCRAFRTGNPRKPPGPSGLKLDWSWRKARRADDYQQSPLSAYTQSESTSDCGRLVYNLSNRKACTGTVATRVWGVDEQSLHITGYRVGNKPLCRGRQMPIPENPHWPHPWLHLLQGQKMHVDVGLQQTHSTFVVCHVSSLPTINDFAEQHRCRAAVYTWVTKLSSDHQKQFREHLWPLFNTDLN